MTGATTLKGLPQRPYSKSALPVPTGSFGILDRSITEGLGFTSMETTRLYSYVALLLATKKPKPVFTLAHIDDYFAQHMSRLNERHMPKRYSNAFIIFSPQSNSSTLDAAIDYGLHHTEMRSVVELASEDTPAAVGIDISGHMYVPSNPFLYYEKLIGDRRLGRQLHGRIAHRSEAPAYTGREVVNMTYFFAMRRNES